MVVVKRALRAPKKGRKSIPMDSKGVKRGGDQATSVKPADAVVPRRSAAKRSLSPQAVDVLEQIGQSIRTSRKARKLTIQELARRAGIARKTLSTIESGTGSASTAGVVEVLTVLDSQLPARIAEIIANDPIGKALLEARLPKRVRKERF